MISLISSFLELIYPEKNICMICNKYDRNIGNNYICKECFNKLELIKPPFCYKCNKSIDIDNKYGICNQCIRNVRYFEQVKSPYYYKGLIKNLIHDYKYLNKPFYYKLFGKLLIDYMIYINYTNFDFIISVPMHRIKQKHRGYNQAELLAKFISKKLSIPYLDVLKRKNNTEKQSSLSKMDRQNNLLNAFDFDYKYNNIIRYKKILIVDDIFTTGTTINECSKILLSNGAYKIFGITISR